MATSRHLHIGIDPNGDRCRLSPRFLTFFFSNLRSTVSTGEMLSDAKRRALAAAGGASKQTHNYMATLNGTSPLKRQSEP